MNSRCYENQKVIGEKNNFKQEDLTGNHKNTD
jgi:hypothetical protein